jgi:hypothetical protein
MSAADLLAIVGIVLAVGGIVVAAYYGHRALNPPKRLIWWHSDATPLISGGHAQYQDIIRVEVLNRPVTDPYIGRLIVENAGSQDIDSSLFDQQRPMRFEVQGARKQATFLDPEGNPPGLHVEGNCILIGPELLRSKSKWTISFVTDGRPKVVLAKTYMVNVNVCEKPSESAVSIDSRISTFRFIGTIILMFLILLAGLIFGLVITAKT